MTLCRCINIPARYCTGYLGDIGVPPDPAPMDFSAWFEVYLGDRWYTFDARHNVPRIGRILMARGRDATDVAISTSFGPCGLLGFKVVTNEVPVQPPRRPLTARRPSPSSSIRIRGDRLIRLLLPYDQWLCCSLPACRSEE